MSASPWDDLPPYEQERIAALPLEEALAAMFAHAPKASSGDALAVLGAAFPGLTKAAVKRVRDRIKAERTDTPAEDVPTVPTREAIIAKLKRAVDMGDAKEVERWARSLAALGRAGNLEPAPETSEDWDRLSDLEAGALIALTRKLNGEALTTLDEAWLARLR